MEFILEPIGVIHSPFKDNESTPVQASLSKAIGQVEVHPEYTEGLWDLEVAGVDVLDGTPLLDIKPYVPDFDIRTRARTGWYETRSIRD